MDDLTNFLTTEQIAKKTGLDVQSVRRIIRNGKITAYKVGRDYRVSPEDFDKWLVGCRVN